MVTVKSNFRRWGGLVDVGVKVGAAAVLPPSGVASFVTASGAIFLSASILYVWNGAVFNGWNISLSGSGS